MSRRVGGSRRALLWVALFLSSALCLRAANFNDGANGNYNANGTWVGGTANPANGTADSVTVDSHTVTITTAADATNDTIAVSGGGALYVGDTANAFDGATIALTGGTVGWNIAGASGKYFGGDFRVLADSRLRMEAGNNGGRSTTNNSLEFAVVSTLAVTNVGSDNANFWNLAFDSATMTESGTLRLWHASRPLTVFLSNVTAAASKTLTVTGKGYLSFVGDNPGMQGTLTLASQYTGIVSGRSSNSLGSATVHINGGTLSSVAACALGTGTVHVNSGGTITDGFNVPNGWRGTTVVMNGGSAEMIKGVGDYSDVGGDLRVSANSTLRLLFGDVSNGGRGAANNSLTFTAPSTLTITNNGWDGQHSWINVFNSGSVEENGMLNLVGPKPQTVQFNSLTVYACRTLTKTGNQILSLPGALRVGIRAGADFLNATNFTIVDYQSGTLTDSSTFNTSDGLWARSPPAANTDILVNLTPVSRMGTIGAGQRKASFAAEDAGYVEVANLVSGRLYRMEMNVDSNTAEVVTHMSANPLLTGVVGVDDRVSFDLVAPLDGTMYFAWDNTRSDLGASVTAVAFQPNGLVIILK